MNEIHISMASKEIKSENRPIRVECNREMIADLNMSHGFDSYDFERVLIQEMRRESRKKSIKNIFRDEHN